MTAPHITPPGAHPAGQEIGQVATRGRTPSRPVVMVDLDNTLWSFIAGLEYALGDDTIEARVDTWDSLSVILGGEDATWRAFDQAFQREVMEQVGPLPGAVAAMEALVAQDVGVVVITSRPASTIEDVVGALTYWQCPWDEVVCGLADKLPLYAARAGRIIIDDHPGTLLRAHRAGLDALSLAWSYNRHVQEAGIALADDWPALLAHVHQSLPRA